MFKDFCSSILSVVACERKYKASVKYIKWPQRKTILDQKSLNIMIFIQT